MYLHVVRRYELMLRGYLAGQLYNLAEADDLAQEVFLTAWRDLGSFRRDGDFGARLRGIARHRLLTHFRSQQRRASAVERFQAEVVRIVSRNSKPGLTTMKRALPKGCCIASLSRQKSCAAWSMPDSRAHVPPRWPRNCKPPCLRSTSFTTAGITCCASA